LIKETTGAFDGAQTHDWPVSTDYKSDVLPTAPRRLVLLMQLLLMMMLFINS